MYESWYLEKYGQYNDFFNGDFDVFGLKKKSSNTRLAQLERLDDESIFDWIEDRDPDNEKASTPANLKLLYVPLPSRNSECSLFLDSLATCDISTMKLNLGTWPSTRRASSAYAA